MKKIREGFRRRSSAPTLSGAAVITLGIVSCLFAIALVLTIAIAAGA